jgi:hypothetical protein
VQAGRSELGGLVGGRLCVPGGVRGVHQADMHGGEKSAL